MRPAKQFPEERPWLRRKDCPDRKGIETSQPQPVSWGVLRVGKTAPIGRGLRHDVPKFSVDHLERRKDCPDRKGMKQGSGVRCQGPGRESSYSPCWSPPNWPFLTMARPEFFLCPGWSEFRKPQGVRRGLGVFEEFPRSQLASSWKQAYSRAVGKTAPMGRGLRQIPIHQINRCYVRRKDCPDGKGIETIVGQATVLQYPK